jgi:hypothetical protein
VLDVLAREQAEEQVVITHLRQEFAEATRIGAWTPWRRFLSPGEQSGSTRCGYGNTSSIRRCQRESVWVSYSPDGRLRKVRCEVHAPPRLS